MRAQARRADDVRDRADLPRPLHAVDAIELSGQGGAMLGVNALEQLAELALCGRVIATRFLIERLLQLLDAGVIESARLDLGREYDRGRGRAADDRGMRAFECRCLKSRVERLRKHHVCA